MAEKVVSEQKFLHPDRKLVTPMDIFLGADFAVGNIVSGGALSGGGLNLQIVSSPTTMRVLNAHLFNNEAGWVEVEFLDGGRHGGLVMGPFRVQGLSERQLTYEEVVGRKFTSSIYADVRSGWTAEPLSNGVNVKASFVKEPTDWRQ